MMKMKKLMMAAAVGVIALAPAAFAAELKATTDLNTKTQVTGSTKSSTKSMAAADLNFGKVISSIQASKTGTMEIQSLTKVKSVNVVNISDLAKGENMTALDNVVNQNNDDIAALRAAMTSNMAVNTALADANVDISAVVATKVSGDGELTVYIR